MPFQFLRRADPAQLRSFIVRRAPPGDRAGAGAHVRRQGLPAALRAAAGAAGGGRPPHRGDGPHLARDHRAPSRRPWSASCPRCSSRPSMSRVGGLDPLVNDHQPLRPLHRAPDRRGPRGPRRRPGRRGQEPDVHVRGHRRPRGPLGAAGAAQRSTPAARARPQGGHRDRSATRSPRTSPSAPRTNLIDEIEILGPVRLTQVEEAQQGIIRSIRELEEQGQIMVRAGERR